MAQNLVAFWWVDVEHDHPIVMERSSERAYLSRTIRWLRVASSTMAPQLIGPRALSCRDVRVWASNRADSFDKRFS